VSEIYGPKAVMSGEILDFKKISLPFGSYCQVHEEKLPRNSLASRTIGAISLGPSGNTQGGQKFFTLNTTKVITRRSWDILPMPQSVIDRVNFIGRDQPSQSVFTDRSGNVIGNDDPSYDNYDPIMLDNNSPGEILPDAAPDHVDITGVDTEDIVIPETSPGTPVEIPGVELGGEQQQTIEINDIDISGQPEPTLVEPPRPATTRRSERQRKTTEKYAPSMSGKSYSYTQLGLTLLQDTRYKHSAEVVAAVLTQLSLKAALKQ
jgi:hypothetical protein